jgi:hypothetical protein
MGIGTSSAAAWSLMWQRLGGSAEALQRQARELNLIRVQFAVDTVPAEMTTVTTCAAPFWKVMRTSCRSLPLLMPSSMSCPIGPELLAAAMAELPIPAEDGAAVMAPPMSITAAAHARYRATGPPTS